MGNQQQAMVARVGHFSTLVVGGYWFSTTDFGARFRQEVLQKNKRLMTWQASLEITRDHPIVGIGPGYFCTRVAEYEPRVKNHSAHNIFFDVAAEAGIPGLLLYLGFFTTAATLLYRDATTNRSAAARWALIMLAAFLGNGSFISWTMLWLGFLPSAMVDRSPPNGS